MPAEDLALAEEQPFASLETRWFYLGPLPPAVRAWFGAGGRQPLAQEARVDRYLRLPGLETLGVKLREGRIELKRRDAQHGAWRFADRAEGHVEAWCKWSLPLETAPGLVEAYARPAADWIAVEKERWLCYFQHGGALCVLELARVALRAPQRVPDPAWTLAFEAWGQGDLRRVLLATACLTLSEPDAPELDAAASYGYPRWLQRAHDRQQAPPESQT